MELNKIYQGDVLENLKSFDDGSVDCVITSPPYWQLRDYGWDGQWGLEKTYQEYLEHLWLMMDELWRVVKDTGTVWINLGDSYSGSAGGFWDKDKKPEHCNAIARIKKEAVKNYPPKSLMLIPHRFAIGCIDRGWILRNDIIWAKRNGMPESVRDRFSKKHEFIFFFVKQQKYYFDLDGVREKHADSTIVRANQPKTISEFSKYDTNDKFTSQGKNIDRSAIQPNGKNPGDVSDFWDVPTQPSSDKHYATYNFDLIDKPIVAGCPEFVCKKCGKPREKIIETNNPSKIYADNDGLVESNKIQKTSNPQSVNSLHRQKGGVYSTAKVTGLTDCGCNAGFEGGVILDPFCGTGTTITRAIQLGRNGIGIDGKEEYCDIANKRIEQELSQLKLAI